MTGAIVIVRAVQTCTACPSQWDAWDDQGRYWYLRYRHGRGSAEMQPSPDTDSWANKEPEIRFPTEHDRYHGYMTLEEFCDRAGITLRASA